MTAAAGPAISPRIVPGTALALASAAHTASADTPMIDTEGAVGLIVVINATASAATPSVVFTIRGVVYPAGATANPTGVEYDILASVAVTGAGTTKLVVDPRVPASANVAAAHPLPDRVYVHAEAGDADSLTYSVSVTLAN